MINQVRAQMPELPRAMAERFVRDYALPEYDANVMTQSKAFAAYFESCALALKGNEKLAANWLMGDVSAQLNRDEKSIEHAPISPRQLAKLILRITDGTISNKIAKEVFAAMWAGEHAGDADTIIDAKGLRQISDTGALEKIIDEVIAANAKSVEEFRAGKDKAFQSLVGQAMKATKGKANPQQVNELLKKKLG
jgi:aspartyl-tRNA(Asn)/glutamyl-tRNA(Gln) amidotransferase subunit B